MDAEVIWATAALEGLVAVEHPAQAEVIVVNTCAFIRSAVEESLETVLELSRYKREGCCRLLVVCGCLTARYRGDLRAELPEVDLFAGPAEAGALGRWLAGELPQRRLRCAPRRGFLPRARTPRVNSLAPGSAYLKVAEGCSRRCSFCVIPKLRGPQRSRPLGDLVEEAENLVARGVQEIVAVAQDLAGWGSDLPRKPDLAELAGALAEVPGVRWLRLMYLFPTRVSERLIALIETRKNVLPYLDLPFQHADAGVLRRMRRGGGAGVFLKTVARLRRRIPGVVLRTSLMTGFPGEDQAAFHRLVRFVERCRFERLGVFVFSPEEGSAAAGLPDAVDSKAAARRREELLGLQRRIAGEYHRSLLGSTLEVLVEERAGGGLFMGRAWNQAPEVDGRTQIRGQAKIGEIVAARVVAAGPYHLEVEVV